MAGLIQRRNRMGMVYTLPWMVGFLCFQVFPIGYSLFVSFHKWDMFTKPKYIALANYQSLLTDPRFHISFRNTVLFMIFSMGLGISLGLFIAALLAENIKGADVYRTIFYLPSLVVPIAFGMMMRPIFAGEGFGLINMTLKLFGIKAVAWLDNPDTAFWVVIITNFWFIGACMVIFWAGIKNISPTYYEAAKIDGAGWWSRFFHITIPMLSPVIFFQIVSGLIYALQIFDIPISLANLAGNYRAVMGRNDALGTLVFYLYMEGFRNWRMGRAAAIGWVILLIGLVFSLLVLRIMRHTWQTSETAQ